MGPDTQRQEQNWALVELERRLSNLARIGVVHEADYPAARLRIRYDVTPDGTPVVTTWLPWITQRAGADRSWWAPEVGEQVMILSPSGDLGQGIVLAGLYQQKYPANADTADLTRVDWDDGSWVLHDRASGNMTVHCTGAVRVTAQRIDLN